MPTEMSAFCIFFYLYCYAVVLFTYLLRVFCVIIPETDLGQMKKVFSILILIVIAFNLNAQKSVKSPSSKTSGSIGGAEIVIKYHKPSARGRKMIGGIEPYGEVWRTGANKATTFETNKDIKVEGKLLPKGKYALFTIPGENEWAIIFNKVAMQWGAFNYDKDEDQLRVNVNPRQTAKYVETFEIKVVSDGVEMKWEDTRVKFEISGQ